MSWTSGSPTVRAQWALQPGTAYLNHGSFGATPRVVLAEHARWQAEMERQPVLLLGRRLPELLEPVRRRVASFVGADPAGMTLVPNATTGVNAVLRSIPWEAGDEILLANQSYNAVKQAVRWVGDRYGVRAVEAQIPFPIQDPAEVVAAYAHALSPRTRLVIVDHVVSPTALVLPVGQIIWLARSLGVPVLVDGAHAPGLLPLNLAALAPDFYTGNLHKWAFAAKGSAFLWVAAPWRAAIHPVTISHGYGAGLAAEFDWTGTTDPSAWLSIPTALDFHASFPGLAANNHALVQDARVRIAAALGSELPHPDHPDLYGPMAAVEFPGGFDGDFGRLFRLSGRMYEEHNIEVPFLAYDNRTWLRVSGQAYNAPEEYIRLAEVLASGWR